MDLNPVFQFFGSLSPIAISLIVLCLAPLFGIAGYLIVFKVLFRVASKPDSLVTDTLVRSWRAPAKFFFPTIATLLVLPSLRFPDEVLSIIRHATAIALISETAWLLITTTEAAKKIVLARFDISVPDNLKARTISTQATVAVKIIGFLIIVIAGAAILMTFDKVKQIGVSMLASAGILGIVIGFAAQRSLGTILAGFQVAITQPIRIDDVVVLEGEWGRIEEINLTYVVVRIWDLRRLVVPITYFLEKPFQNWTRNSSDLLGTVTFHCDYSVPVAAVRAELDRVLLETPLWDGKVSNLVVVEAKDKTLMLRALVSARDSSTAWDLQCFVREKLIEFLQRAHPESLPQLRIKK